MFHRPKRLAIRRAVLAGMSALLLAACSPATWSRPPGVTDADFARDDEECQRESGITLDVGPDMRDLEAPLYNRCMRQRGYVQQ